MILRRAATNGVSGTGRLFSLMMAPQSIYCIGRVGDEFSRTMWKKRCFRVQVIRKKRPKDGSTIKELMMMTQQVLQGEVISLRPRPNSPTSCRVYTRHAAGSTHHKLPGLHTTSCCWRRALVTLALQTSWQGVGHQADKI